LASIFTLGAYLWGELGEDSRGDPQATLRNHATFALLLPYVLVLALVLSRRARSLGVGIAVGMGIGLFALMSLVVMMGLAGATLAGGPGSRGEFWAPFVRGFLFLWSVQALLVLNGLLALFALPYGQRKAVFFSVGVLSAFLCVFALLALGLR
jgi:hypothetical protein